jgi:hypothetical protein
MQLGIFSLSDWSEHGLANVYFRPFRNLLLNQKVKPVIWPIRLHDVKNTSTLKGMRSAAPPPAANLQKAPGRTCSMALFDAAPRKKGHKSGKSHKGILRLVAAATAICLTTACGGGKATIQKQQPTYTATTVEPAVLRAGQAVPLPDKPILTVRGKIATTNSLKTLRLDAKSLDHMGVLKVRVFEPALKKQMTFQGVWLADMLKVARIQNSASAVHFTALDDFQSDLTTTQIDKGGIFLATKSGDGSPIPIQNGGPTRLVFMDGVSAGKNPDAWVWSLKTLDVK